jgi:RNA polymerase sigma factor (sigma-70 family)
VERQEGLEALDEAIRQLQPRERQLFEMRQQDGLSTEEIAQQTGIAKASVQSMVAMARKKVFNEMKRRMNL